MNNKVIGGYFGLEQRFESEFYPHLIRLNTGRNCIEYILRARKYKKIYVPAFTCSAVMEPIHKLKLEFEYYSINTNLEPQEIKSLAKDEVMLIINYFGLKSDFINLLSKQISNLIVDNSQAFFEAPIPDIDTFYTARKFFGVPDGAYLSTNCFLERELPTEISWNRSEYLVRRLENGANDGYPGFLENEKYLCGQEIKLMSNFTYCLLSGINYRSVKIRRNQNFQYLHLKLGAKNLLTNINTEVDGPMIYPLLVENGDIRNELINQKIFVATYWPNVLEENKKNSIEYGFAKNLLPLPVDQRYGLLDMDKICSVLNSLI
ncbi:MAG: hypothetical protein COC06_09040 [Bacteroidales bacterium]|nr:MAG: hypothetical protein COC06_09040 [Bacteroidales bacterium]